MLKTIKNKIMNIWYSFLAFCVVFAIGSFVLHDVVEKHSKKRMRYLWKRKQFDSEFRILFLQKISEYVMIFGFVFLVIYFLMGLVL